MMRRFSRDEGGNFAIMTAAALSALLGAGALAVDLSNAFYVKTKLQSASDAAALAAVLQLPKTTAASGAALDLAGKNTPPGFGTITKASDVVLGTYDTTTKAFTPATAPYSVNVNAVKVTAARTVAGGNALPAFFAARSPEITTSAIAVRIGPVACFLALASSGNAFSATGGGTVSVPNCGIGVNSSSNNAAKASGSSTVNAQSVSIVGSYSGTFSPAPKTGQQAVADPLASLPEPTAGTCTPSTTNFNNNGLNVTISQGTYCGTFTVSSGTVTFSPGIYYFQNCSINISGTASLVGSGVMWFLDANSPLTHTPNGTVQLSAPTSGTYEGVVIMESRSSAANKKNKLTGNANFNLDGTIYMPNTNLTMVGNGSISDSSKSGYVITSTFTFSGTSSFTFDSYTGVTAKALFNQAVLVQ